MISARQQQARRFHLLGLAAALALLLAIALAAASRAQAVPYGGLGPVGSTITSGTGGGHGQVNPNREHAFVVDPETGDLFIADELQEKEKFVSRLQEFSATGGFLAENRIKLRVTERLGGLAIDPRAKSGERVYMLLDEERPEESEKIEEKIEKVEEKIAKAEEKLSKAKEKAEKEALEKEIQELQAELAKLEGELPVFDPGELAAAELLAFSTTPSKEKLPEQTLTGREVLQPDSEEGKVPLLHPGGIAVDPKTHDVIIAGQQDESIKKGEGEEDLRAAVQRVNEAGTLGPRYIDKKNCLDQAEPVSTEPHCKESEAEEEDGAISPVVTSGGNVYVQDGEEVWQFPASGGTDGAETEVLPKWLYSLGEENDVFGGVAHEEEGGSMSFVASKSEPAEGTLYVDIKVKGASNGLLALGYTEHGKAGAPEAKEIGWTAGQEKLSPQVKCVLVSLNLSHPIMVAGGGGESVFALSTEGGYVKQFGRNAAAEACGHQPTVTPPSVEVGNNPNATEVGIGEPVKLSSKMEGANATSVLWKFKYKNPSTGETEEEQQETTTLQSAPTLPFTFKRAGVYEISEVVTTDNLSFPGATAETVTVKTNGFKLKLAQPEPVPAGQEVILRAAVTDGAETTPHLKYTWKFGDGTSAQGEKLGEGTPNEARLSIGHTYSSPGVREITLEVEDGSKLNARAAVKITIGESATEREEREREERERAERETHEREGRERAEREAHELAERQAHERNAGGGVLGSITTNNPEAKLAGTAVSVSPSGVFTLKVTCPSGEATCIGTVTLRTAAAVSASAHKKKAILTLATGSFTVAGGQTKALTLHLSAKARALLARSHVLRAKAALVAHDPAGVKRTVNTSVTLRLAKAAHKH